MPQYDGITMTTRAQRVAEDHRGVAGIATEARYGKGLNA